MIPWLREKAVRSGVKLKVGGYLPPLRARVFLMGLALITLLIGMLTSFVLLGNDDRFMAAYEQTGLPDWSYYLVALLPLGLPGVFVATPLGQWLGEVFIGSRVTLIVTKDYVQEIRWLVYRPKHPLGAGPSFERLPHPRARDEVLGNQLRKAQHPKNPARAVQFYEYQKAGVVALRSGPTVVRLANIFDRKPAGLGHKADVLVQTLQRIHGEILTGNRSAEPAETPLQYGPRPSIA